jgi:phospholipase C
VDSLASIKHVVILMQENRSFDQYFGTFPGANGFYDPSFVVNGSARLSWPFRYSTFSSNAEQPNGDSHFWPSMQANYTPNEGCLPNADTVSNGVQTIYQGYGYYAANDIPYHWLLASTFTLCDHWFGSVLGSTAPNRLYLMSGCIRDPNGPFSPPGDRAQDTIVNPGLNLGVPADPFGNPVYTFQNGPLNWDSYPVTLQKAQASGALDLSIKWNVYDETQSASFELASEDPSFNVESLDPGFQSSFIAPRNTSNGWGTMNILNTFANSSGSNLGNPTASFADAVAAGELPTISWIIPPFGASEWHNHPSDGAQYIATKLTAILNSGQWDSTVFIVVYDENDGAFDHVDPQPPKSTDANIQGTVEAYVDGGPTGPVGPGYRVPALIISPWTVNPTKKPGWDASGVTPNINSQPCDHTAVLQLLEIVTGVQCPNIGAWRSNRFPCGETFWNNIFNWNSPVGATEVLALLPTPAEVVKYQENAQIRLLPFVNADGSNNLAYYSAPPAQSPGSPNWPPVQQQFYFQILSQLSFSEDDVRAAQETSTAFTYSLVLDSFDSNEIAGLSVLRSSPQNPLPRSLLPNLYIYLDGSDADALANISITAEIDVSPTPLTQPKISSPAVSDAQRWTVTFTLAFDNPAAAFTNVSAKNVVSLSVNAVFSSNLDWSTSFPIELVAVADPFMLTGPIQYLSTDLRAYQILVDNNNEIVTSGNYDDPFNIDFGGDPNGYITEVLAKLNANDPSLAGFAATFGSDPALAPDPDSAEAAFSQVSLFPTQEVGGATYKVFSFAIARVTLQGLTEQASNVQVFFRLFRAPSAGTFFSSYDPGSAYSSVAATNPDVAPAPALRMPTLGLDNGQVLTMPFFAAKRASVSPNNPDLANWHSTINPSSNGEPVYTYFGCWIDINDPTAAVSFNVSPLQPPITLPLAALAASEHQCLVAEIAYGPLPIPTGAIPGLTTDLLAQRNLAVLGGGS